MNKNFARILCVGHVCIDVVSECEYYPSEDEKIGTNTAGNRCLSLRWQRGGNAANSATALAVLGECPAFMGTIADSDQKSFLINDFTNYNIDLTNAIIVPGSDSPTSNVILSQSTGSRTIIHSNSNLPEVSIEQFKAIDLSKYLWIHFEGRNIDNVVEMIKHIELYCSKSSSKITISVEIEKPTKLGIDQLLPLGDVVFISKDYAAHHGCSNMDQAMVKFAPMAKPTATIICPWGDKGACAQDSAGTRVHSVAFPPEKVVDTLGAGDTFNAAAILGLASEWSLLDSITFGCKVAGLKVGVKGWKEFKQKIEKKEIVDYLHGYFSRRRLLGS